MKKSAYLLLIVFLMLSSCVKPTEITKDSSQTEDSESLSAKQSSTTIIVSNTSDEGPGSFRQALLVAGSGDVIVFDPATFSPDDPAVIKVESELPHIRQNNLILDASNAGVIIDGAEIEGELIAGLQLVSSRDNTIMGLQISNFSGPAIAISGGASNNKIGGDRNIGKGPFGQGNLLIHNSVGVDISMNKTELNIVTGNIIGTDLSGNQELGNSRSGVLLWEGAHDNTIGPNNIIAFNKNCGVEGDIGDSTSNMISQNNIYDNGDTGACLFGDDFVEITDPIPDSEEDLIQYNEPDIIFLNGTIITMDENFQTAEAIAIKNGIVSQVGNNPEISALEGEKSVVVDLEGKTLLPGFVDAHNHLLEAHEKNFEEEQNFMLANGVTTIGILYATQEWIDELGKFDQQTGLKVRTNLYLSYCDACGEVYGDWYANYSPTEDKSKMLRINGVKVYTDGGACNLPAVSYEYPNGGYGDLYFTQEELDQIVKKINGNGFQAALHALGDRAAEQVLNAIESANIDGVNVMHNRIEHSGIIRDDMLGRHDESGAVATIFGNFPTCYFIGENWKFASGTPEEYKHTEWRWKDLIDANPNTVFAWHSDAGTIAGPKSLGIFVLGPMENLNGYVNRRDIGMDGKYCEPQDWMLENTISVDQALRLMTINSAYALRMEDVIGSLEPGKFADLVILSDNPLTIAPKAINSIEVLMTMVNGKAEYCAPGHLEFCP